MTVCRLCCGGNSGAGGGGGDGERQRCVQPRRRWRGTGCGVGRQPVSDQRVVATAPSPPSPSFRSPPAALRLAADRLLCCVGGRPHHPSSGRRRGPRAPHGQRRTGGTHSLVRKPMGCPWRRSTSRRWPRKLGARRGWVADGAPPQQVAAAATAVTAAAPAAAEAAAAAVVTVVDGTASSGGGVACKRSRHRPSGRRPPPAD